MVNIQMLSTPTILISATSVPRSSGKKAYEITNEARTFTMLGTATLSKRGSWNKTAVQREKLSQKAKKTV
jgi:hypothetical protein